MTHPYGRGAARPLARPLMGAHASVAGALATAGLAYAAAAMLDALAAAASPGRLKLVHAAENGLPASAAGG